MPMGKHLHSTSSPASSFAKENHMCINNDDDNPILCVGYNTVSNPFLPPSLPPCPLTITTN